MPDYEPRIADATAPAGEDARPRATGPGNRRKKQDRMTGGRRRASSRVRAGRTERWQLLAMTARIVIELLEPFLDRFYGGGPV